MLRSMLSLSILGTLLTAGAAHADSGTLPSVRKQIMANAKAEHVLSGLSRPSLRLTYQGKTVLASIYAVGTGGIPGGKPHRMLQDEAKFRLGGLTLAGRHATPLEQNGRVWSQVLYAKPFKTSR